MKKIILAVAVIAAAAVGFYPRATPVHAPNYQPCVWPNTCAAQFQPCVWPNHCKTDFEAIIGPCPLGVVCKNEVAQFTSCVWPNTCSKKPS